MLFVQCSKGSGTIAPIIPSGDYSFQSERILPPDDYDYGDRSGYQNRTNVLLQVTAPAEYITSQLNPPLVTDNQPTFSAIVHNNISRLSEDDFIATVDGEHVRCMFNAALNEVSFAPVAELKNGNHHAMLIFKNPDGSARSLFWSFRIETEPPNINLVMWSKKENYALVMLDRPVEPSLLADTSRWLINNETGITRADIYLLGGTTAFLPLKSSYFDKYTNKEPLTITFVDKNGSADYIVNRGGSMVRKGQEDPECDCNISVDILQEHHILEAGAEKYAFCYEITSQETPRCNLVMEWDNWSISPIANLDPVGVNENDNKYDLPVDTLCGGISQADPPPWELGFQMILYSNEIETVALERVYSYDLDVSFWADCEPPWDEYETWIANKHFSFGESFDCLLPEFDEEPIVLYGNEAADLIHYEWMESPLDSENWKTGIPLADEVVTGDLYCFGIDSFNYRYLMGDLIEHKCDLFIVTKASDPTTQGTDGNMNITQMVLDYKYTNGTYRYGDSYINNDPLTCVLVIDKKPWASTNYGAEDDRELITFPDGWPDPNYKQSPEGMWHDWSGEEIAINWWNLTDILTTPSDKVIQGIKVRITDNTQDPVDGYHGNWRRSADVMEQLCDLVGFPERGGLSESSRCDSEVSIEYIAKNPREYVPSGEEKEWKRTGFYEPCNFISTNFIVPREANGTSEILVAAYLKNKDSRKANPCAEQDRIYAKVRSFEQGDTGHPKIDIIELRKWDEANVPYDLSAERVRSLLGAPYFVCINNLFLGKLIVSDDLLPASDAPNDGQLYVSSRDHRLPLTDPYYRMDLGISFAYSLNEDEGGEPFWKRINYIGNLNYGRIRGIGAGGPDMDEEQNFMWYGYDDYIKRAGFEVVEIFRVTPEDDNFFFPMNNDGKHRFAQFQSEADVLIIRAHSTVDGTSDLNPFPIFSPFKYPLHHYWLDSWGSFSHYDAMFFSAHPDTYTIPGKPMKHNDFAPPDEYFWGKSNSPMEMKWVVVFGCNSVAFRGPYSPGMKWISHLSAGYAESVCGFSYFLGGGVLDFDAGGDFLNNYTDKLKDFTINSQYPDENGFYYSDPNLYDDYKFNNGGSDDFTKDPSVAAFMETAANLCKYPLYLLEDNDVKKGCTNASGIAKEGVWYSVWNISDKECSDAYGQIKHDYYIVKE